MHHPTSLIIWKSTAFPPRGNEGKRTRGNAFPSLPSLPHITGDWICTKEQSGVSSPRNEIWVLLPRQSGGAVSSRQPLGKEAQRDKQTDWKDWLDLPSGLYMFFFSCFFSYFFLLFYVFHFIILFCSRNMTGSVLFCI